MAFSMARSFEHNQATVAISPVMKRMYDVPTSWTPPAAKGVWNSRTQTIQMMEYPEIANQGWHNPRTAGIRVVQGGLDTTTIVGFSGQS